MMKTYVKHLMTLIAVLFVAVLMILPVSATEDVCTDFDDTYQSGCDCVDPVWNGVEYYERGSNYTAYIDVCNDCFVEYIYKVWDAHDFEERTVGGKLFKVCKNCQDAYLLDSDSGDSGDDGDTGDPDEGDGGSGDGSCVHKFKTTVVPPNCEERGYTWYECILCDYAVQGDWKDKTDHSYKHVMTVQPTCIKSGYVYYVCEYCGVPPSAEVGYTPPLGHSWATVSSEVGEDNMITIKSECTRCHVTKEEVHETAAGQAQNWLLTAIRGTSAGLIDSYETLANGIEVGGITLGEVITAALIVVAIVAVIAVIVKFVG